MTKASPQGLQDRRLWSSGAPEYSRDLGQQPHSCLHSAPREASQGKRSEVTGIFHRPWVALGCPDLPLLLGLEDRGWSDRA